MSNRFYMIAFSNKIALLLILLFINLFAKSQTTESINKSDFLKLGYNEINFRFSKDKYSNNLINRYRVLRGLSYAGLLLAPTSLINNVNPQPAILIFSASSIYYFLSNKRLLYKDLFDSTKAKNFVNKSINDSINQFYARSNLIRLIDTSDLYNKQNEKRIRLKIIRVDRSLNAYFDNKIYENADDSFLVNKSEFIKMSDIDIKKRFSKNKKCVNFIEAYNNQKYTKILYLGLTGFSSALTFFSYQELNTSHNDIDMLGTRPLTFFVTSFLTAGSLTLFLNDIYAGRRALLYKNLKKNYYH